MELYLHHGRKTPDEQLDDWGPNGPRLAGVKGIHQTYGNAANVHFDDQPAADEARRLTGWDAFDASALTMRWQEELVHVKGPDGTVMLYGDWGIM